MIWLLAACALGLPAGFLLLWRIPLCQPTEFSPKSVSVIIPARNEERNLPALLESIGKSKLRPQEVIVVDDASTDNTASVASGLGARVIPSRKLEAGWTGKTWACTQGAEAATSEAFLFLDADTFFAADGFERLVGCVPNLEGESIALSVLPFHIMKKPYEQLSLVFNLLMAFGAGGFGALGSGRLFGQSLYIRRELYEKCGGHSAVRGSILENLRLSSNIEDAGAACMCRGGRGVLNIRMFPEGFSQLCEGWTKAFADGAAASDPGILLLSIFWLTALCASSLLLVLAPGLWSAAFLLLYCMYVLQLIWLGRQVGNYHPLICLFYPVPVIFFFVIFAGSLQRRIFKRKVSWRGRNL